MAEYFLKKSRFDGLGTGCWMLQHLLTSMRQVADLSKEVVELKEELQKAAAEEEAGEQSLLQLTNSVTQSDIQTLILESISGQNYQKAVQCMQQFRWVPLWLTHTSHDLLPSNEVGWVIKMEADHREWLAMQLHIVLTFLFLQISRFTRNVMYTYYLLERHYFDCDVQASFVNINIYVLNTIINILKYLLSILWVIISPVFVIWKLWLLIYSIVSDTTNLYTLSTHVDAGIVIYCGML